MQQGGVAAFALPPAGARRGEGLLLVTPARNSSALEAWAHHFREQFPGRRAHVLFEPSAEWRPADAGPLADLLSTCFSDITIALNSDARAFVEAIDMARTAHSSRPIGPALELTASLDRLLEGQDSADLVCVCPAHAAGLLSVLRHLETKGLSRQQIGGLASVRHCR